MPERARIGDDVVDLGDPAIAQHHRRARFVARVCNDDERRRVAAAHDPHRLLWSLFAAKEAAFKALEKRAPLILAHRRFEVAADLVSVRHASLGATLALRVTGGPGHVHAVAWLGDARWTGAVRALAADEDPSAAARRLLRAAVAPHLGCAVGALRVERAPRLGGWTGAAPPVVWRDHDGAWRDAGLDVSLSHDGRFIAVAASLPR